MGRRWECFLLVFMMCEEFRGDGTTIIGIFASASPSHHIVYHYNEGTSSPWASGDCYQHCLNVRVQGIFTHIVASLDTQCLRSKCTVSRRLRKLNSAQVGVQYCMVNSIRIETLRDLSSSYVPEDAVQVEVECGELYEPVEIQTQHTRSWSAAEWPPLCLCYRPAVFFDQLRPTASSFHPETCIGVSKLIVNQYRMRMGLDFSYESCCFQGFVFEGYVNLRYDTALIGNRFPTFRRILRKVGNRLPSGAAWYTKTQSWIYRA